ncbi:hypothetical protein EOD04_19790 [Mesorhizobium sp. M2C.T.Ca.TU.009.01.2.1]|nr:hypothetical protein EOD04_19790 [Mesorhizobium sp. M2C.T.Ca.TU.009.01.2.1]
MGWVSRSRSLVLLSFLAACSSLTTSSTPKEGIPYFLPLTKVRYIVDYDTPSQSTMESYNTADRSRPYYLSYQEDSLADENLCVDRTDTGLLKKIYFGAQDRLPDVILNVLEIAARSGVPVSGEEQEVNARGRCSGKAISEWMDPYDQVAISRFNATLCGIKVEVPDFSGIGSLPETACPRNGVCFATKSDFQYYFRSRNGNIINKGTGTVASRRDVGWINIKTAFFNKRITLLDFNEGVLNTVRIRKDSEILGISQLPLNAVERLLAVPGNALGMAFAGYQERLLYLQQRKALKDAGAVDRPAQDPDTAIATTVTACKPSG